MIKTYKNLTIGLLLTTIALFLSLLIPQTAFAKSCTMDSTNIDAVLGNSNMLTVTDTRTYTFDGKYTVAYLGLQCYKLDNFRVREVTLNEQKLEETAFKTEWRESGSPENACYSIDRTVANDYQYVYVFCPEYFPRNSTITIKYSVDYFAVTNPYDSSKDCINWELIKNFDVDLNNVKVTLTLPEGVEDIEVEDGVLDNNVIILEKPTVRAKEKLDINVNFKVPYNSKIGGIFLEHGIGSSVETFEYKSQSNNYSSSSSSDRKIPFEFIIIVVVVLFGIALFTTFNNTQKKKINQSYNAGSTSAQIQYNPLQNNPQQYNNQNTQQVYSQQQQNLNQTQYQNSNNSNSIWGNNGWGDNNNSGNGWGSP